jgi:putative component of membrane protein insertase Oxa1/YidC/SpoIIIJ protein YidD
VSKICILLIEFYQKYLSFDTGILQIFAPGGACKYNPTCSEYTKQAIIKYGVIKGIGKGAKRIWSCR